MAAQASISWHNGRQLVKVAGTALPAGLLTAILSANSIASLVGIKHI
jgi:hypothetical protein